MSSDDLVVTIARILTRVAGEDPEIEFYVKEYEEEAKKIIALVREAKDVVVP